MIKIGCCGFARGKKEYFKHFKLIEVQQTFYRIISDDTLMKWRHAAPVDFEFTVKAFQGITHTINSPTWRRSGVKLKGDERYGNLQPSEEVFESWEITKRECMTLNAKICLIQLPKRFTDNRENIENSKNFFSSIDRDGLEIAVEMRGWSDKNIERLCREYNLIDCRDPFLTRPVFVDRISYLRLHGSPPGDRMYRYRYTEEDLYRLWRYIKNLDAREIYVLFNNIYMFDDARNFQKILKKEEDGEGWDR